MSTTSRFDAKAFSGEWNVIAGLNLDEYSEMTFSERENGRLSWHMQGNNALIGTKTGKLMQIFEVKSNGVLVPKLKLQVAKRKNENLLIHWVDEDFRTAVVGYASREDAWILNRTPTLRADRLQAAKDILKFNGYDLAQLKVTPQ